LCNEAITTCWISLLAFNVGKNNGGASKNSINRFGIMEFGAMLRNGTALSEFATIEGTRVYNLPD